MRILKRIFYKSKNHSKIDNLLSKFWFTKGTRFTADEKLRAKNRWSTLSLSMMSIYLIFIYCVDLIGIVPTDEKIYMALCVLFLSLFSLVINLLETAKNQTLEAKQMHDCALEVQNLYHELQLRLENKTANSDYKESLRKKYNEILAKYPNHEGSAYWVFKARNFHEDNVDFAFLNSPILKFLFSRLVLIWCWIKDFSLYAFFVFIPPIAFGIWLYFIINSN